MAFWRQLLRFLPKKEIYIEGNAAPADAAGAEILEGEAGPVKVYFDEHCEYDIVEREISPAKRICPVCESIVLAGMDFCGRCGARQEE